MKSTPLPKIPKRAYRRTSYLVRRVQLAIGALVERAVGELDLTAGQYILLSLLSREGGMSSAALARRNYVTPQAMSELVGTLEKRGLIARAPLTTNARVLQVELTEFGRKLLRTCDRAIDKIEKRFFAPLRESEILTLRDMFERLLGEGD